MKKILFILFMLSLMYLVGCTKINPDVLVIQLNPGIDTIELGSSHQDAGAQASYGQKSLDVHVVSNDIDVNQVGTYEIIYQVTYKDITKYTRRIIDVIDQKAPILALNPGIDTITVGEIWIDTGIMVDDESEIESIIIVGSVGSIIGDYTILYQVTDVFGNTSMISRIISVIESME